MPATTHNLALVKGILDGMIWSRDLRPLLDALADDVLFTLATRDGGHHADPGRGKAAIIDYLEPLGDLVTFWQVRYSWKGARVVVLAEERFTIQPCGLAAHSRFVLLFDLRDGRITRFGIVEEPRVQTSPQGTVPSADRYAPSLVEHHGGRRAPLRRAGRGAPRL